MKNTFVNIVVGALVGLVSLAGLKSVAQTFTTVTNRGEVIQIATASNVAANVADTAAVQDKSIYPNDLGRKGQLVRVYRFSENGGSTNAGITLSPNDRALTPGSVVVGGYIQVLQAFAPAATATNTSFGLNSLTDLLPVGTNLLTTGIRALSVTGPASAIVATNFNPRVKFNAAPTQGVAVVVLDVIQAVP